MKRTASLVVAIFLAACTTVRPGGVSAPQPQSSAPVAASSLEEHPGASFAEAVLVPRDAPGEGTPFESDWIYLHFGAFRRQNGGMTSRDGRHFDVITFETRDRAVHTVYFDTTDLWNALYPTPPK